MRLAVRKQKAIVTGLPPGEAAAFLETLTSGYEEAQQAARRAYSPGERQARQELARDLRRLTLQERTASHHIQSRATARLSGRSVGRAGRSLQAAGDSREREAGA